MVPVRPYHISLGLCLIARINRLTVTSGVEHCKKKRRRSNVRSQPPKEISTRRQRCIVNATQRVAVRRLDSTPPYQGKPFNAYSNNFVKTAKNTRTLAQKR